MWRWTLWYVCLAIGMLLFYVLLTPLWLGLRWAAWVAEFSARRRRPAQGLTAGDAIAWLRPSGCRRGGPP